MYPDITPITTMVTSEKRQVSDWKNTPHISLLWASYGVSIVRIWEETEHIMTASHYNAITVAPLKFGNG